MTPWRLFTIHGPYTGKTTHLDGQLRIGRDADNEICIPDGQVSRCHAQIEPTDSGYTITDMGSTNGTFVNDKRVTLPTLLHIGDTITIGPARFLVLAEATSELA